MYIIEYQLFIKTGTAFAQFILNGARIRIYIERFKIDSHENKKYTYTDKYLPKLNDATGCRSYLRTGKINQRPE